MAEQRHADEGIQEQARMGTAVKRRGLIAGAAALAAGVIAKQASQPALAATASVVYSTTGPGSIPNDVGTMVLLEPGAGFSDSVMLQAQNTGSANITLIQSVIGLASTPGTAVSGIAGTGVGVSGTSASGTGVQGSGGGDTSSNTTGFPIGVRGSVPARGYGMYGQSGVGTGVFGQSMGGYGVYGIGGSNGVIGESTNGNGVYGVANAAGTTGIVAGVYGTSTKTYGVIGSTTASGYSGLTAITGTAGVAALAATSTSASAYAAYFQGTTVVQGNFVAFGGSKSAAVKDATGQHRLVYCVESPEAWFEDFGEAKVVGGTAQVALDKTFAEITHTDAYQVFLTEYGGHNDLFVAKRTASGFEVRTKDGTASAAFGWRVVAKRKDIVGERLARFDVPKINHPDPDKLPIPPSGHPEPPKKP